MKAVANTLACQDLDIRIYAVFTPRWTIDGEFAQATSELMRSQKINFVSCPGLGKIFLDSGRLKAGAGLSFLRSETRHPEAVSFLACYFADDTLCRHPVDIALDRYAAGAGFRLGHIGKTWCACSLGVSAVQHERYCALRSRQTTRRGDNVCACRWHNRKA